MRVEAFYSLLRGFAIDGFWHNQSECPIGQSIPQAERLLGTGPLSQYCPYCELLAQLAPSTK